MTLEQLRGIIIVQHGHMSNRRTIYSHLIPQRILHKYVLKLLAIQVESVKLLEHSEPSQPKIVKLFKLAYFVKLDYETCCTAFFSI